MNTWADDIELSLKNLGGIAKLSDIYDEVERVREGPYPKTFTAIIRGTIENHSSDSANYKGNDRFFSAEGLGFGRWGLRSDINSTPEASDIDENSGVELPSRVAQETYRILRDTQLARKIKLFYHSKCQICGEIIYLSNGEKYSEAHHIKPLGRPHNGSDVAGNIIILCPNHHVMLDCGVIELNKSQIRIHESHRIQSEYIEYHNQNIWNKIR